MEMARVMDSSLMSDHAQEPMHRMAENRTGLLGRSSFPSHVPRLPNAAVSEPSERMRDVVCSAAKFDVSAATASAEGAADHG